MWKTDNGKMFRPITTKPLLLDGKICKEKLADKKIMKICVRKLRHIMDAEEKLHRAVLLNNTLQKIKKQINDDSTMKSVKEIKEETRCASQDMFSLESEISLPPPLNTNQLDQFSIDAKQFSSLEKLNEIEKPTTEITDYPYNNILTTYHLEEEINLYETFQNCDNYLIQRTH